MLYTNCTLTKQLRILTDYLKAPFVDDKAPYASTAIQQVPYSIWNAFSPDLLREPLPSYVTPQEFDRFVHDQRRQFESYDVHVPGGYPKGLTELLEANNEICELVAVKRNLAKECQDLMQTIQDGIRRHGI